MRIVKRWLALLLTIPMALSDCGGITAFAAENAAMVETSVSGNSEESLQADDENTISGEMPVGQESIAENEMENTDSETDTEKELPPLHIGWVKAGEKFPDLEDSEFAYDLPVSFDESDSVVLFANYNKDMMLEKEEQGTLVWSILRGEKGMEEGSVSLINEEDDWKGFEIVSDSPYFTMTEREVEESGFYKTAELAVIDAADYEGYNYYVRAAYYAGTAEGMAEEFYSAATVPVLPKEVTEQADMAPDEMRDDVVDSEETNGDQAQDGVVDSEETGGDQEQIDGVAAGETDLDDLDKVKDDTAEEGEINTDRTQSEAIDVEEPDIDPAQDDQPVGVEGDEIQQDPVQTIRELKLDKSSITMHPGEMAQVTATVEPADVPAKIVWKSSNKDVAAVDANGGITAKVEGKAQITAECDDITAIVKVEVVRADTDKMVDLSGDIWVAGFEKESEDLVYTGQKVTQDIRVYYKDTLLKEKTDYTLSYKNNINAAAYNDAKAPSVTINLKGQYSGSVTLHYTIRPMDINDIDPYTTNQGASAGQKASPGYEQTIVYSKNLKIPTPDLKFGKIKLKANKDFVCDYAAVPEGDADFVQLPEDYKNGDAYEYGKVYDYIVGGTGNFTGSFKMRFVVVRDKALNFSSAVVMLDAKQYEYHGTALSKADVKIVSLKLNNQVLENSLYDYEVCAEEITGAYVTVYPSEAGRSAGYRGSKKVNLKLAGDRNMKDAALGEKWQESILFSQETLNEEGGLFQEKTGVLIFKTEAGQEILTEGQDYTVKYSNAKKVGKVTVTFTGKGRYRGVRKEKYEIKPNADQKNFKLIWKNVTYEKDGTPVVAYQKGGAVPEFVLKDQDNNILKNKTDYTVKLKDNTVPGTTMSCVITGKGNYKGYSRTEELKVTNGDISKGTVSASDKPYGEKQDAWKSKVTIKDVNGKQLTAGKDYSNVIQYTYAGKESGQLPQKNSIVTVTVYGTGCYEGSEITGSYRIYEKNISKLKIAIDAQEYTGEEITLVPGWEESWENGWKHDIHVYTNAADMKNKKNELTGQCYEIVGYKNNIKAGNAQVTLRGIGEYGGTKTCSFKIQKRKYLINRVKRITLDQTDLSVRLADKKAVLTATLVPEEQGEEIANPTVIWSVSDSRVATVEANTVDGPVATVTFRKEGTVTITATAQDGNRKAQCKLTIVNVPLLKEAGQTLKGKVGDTCQLTVVWEESQEENPVNLKWESNNPDRVSVDKNGLVTMKKIGAAVITLRVGNSKYIQQCNVVVEGEEEEKLPEGNYITYKQKPGTVDDAIAINKLLRDWEWNPGLCDYLYIPAGVYQIGAAISDQNGFGGIVLTDNQKLVMSPSALLVAIGNSSNNYRIIYAFGRDNVTISGGQIIGDRDIHTGKGGEAGHGIQIDGCRNVHISDVEISKCWGDGIYLGAYSGEGKPSCDGVTIENCNLHHNRRSNLSITDANNVSIDHCQFNYASGTDPQYGIDIEYNYRTTEHVKISNSTFKGNAKASMGIIKGANDIRLENCTLDGAFYNMAGRNVVLKNTTIKGEIVDRTGGIKREK